MQDVYMTTCSGQGDTYIKFVDKETWDWFETPFAEPPASAIARAMKEQGEYYDAPNITSGSAQNDAVLWAAPLIFDGKSAFFYSVAEVFKFAKKNDLNIVDSFEGYIY